MAQRITHVLVERNAAHGSPIVRSRHESEAAAEAAAQRSNRALDRRYPSSGGTTVLVSYEALEVWYQGERQTAPAVGSQPGIYTERYTDYALATTD